MGTFGTATQRAWASRRARAAQPGMRRKKWLTGLAVAAVVFASLYGWLLVQSGTPETPWPIDLVQVRQLAKSQSGDLPTEVRVERVATFGFPSHAVMAGSGWQLAAMGLYAYQLVYPTRTAI